MKMDRVASSQNDEFYTPPHAVRPILKYFEHRAISIIACAEQLKWSLANRAPLPEARGAEDK